MKKVVLILAIISIVFALTNKTEEYVIVPNTSIRFRIIPNSNSIEDLAIKEKVKEEINSVIKDIEEANNIQESRQNIIENIPLIEEKITKLFEEENYNQDFEVKYGMNYFPEKIYKGVKYESGNYESMVVEIGASSGDNYWCVLFPPLCLIDAEESEEVEYKFFITEILEKFF